jgi:hypothetical protein
VVYYGTLDRDPTDVDVRGGIAHRWLGFRRGGGSGLDDGEVPVVLRGNEVVDGVQCSLGSPGARSASKIDSRGEGEEQPEALGRRCLRSSIKSSVNCGIGQRKSIRGCVGGWGVGKTKQGLRLLDLPTVSSRSWP